MTVEQREWLQPGQAPTADSAAITRQTQEDLEGWVARWPIFDQARLPALAETTAVHLADSSRQARAIAGLVSLWIIGFDDIVDENPVNGRALAARLATYGAIVEGGPAPKDDPLGLSLQHIVHSLQRLTSFGRLGAYWRSTFRAMLSGTVNQRRLGRIWVAGTANRGHRRPVPDYDAVLGLLRDSVGVEHYLATCFILYDDPAVSSRISHLRPLSAACAVAIRLANDLRTWPKDAHEDNFNTLVALQAEIARGCVTLSSGACRARALEALSLRLAAAVEQTRRLLDASPCPNGQAEAGIGRLLRVVTNVYAVDDYHSSRTYASVPPV